MVAGLATISRSHFREIPFVDWAARLKTYRESNRLSQKEMGEALGMGRAQYGQVEAGLVNLPSKYFAIAAEILRPRLIASTDVEIPFVGSVSASAVAYYTDPADVSETVPVPSQMAGEGRFAARVDGDSMYPLLWPDDLAVFQATPIPKLSRVVLYRTEDIGGGKTTIKGVEMREGRLTLVPRNETYDPVTIDGGSVLGYLVGVKRKRAGTTLIAYNEDGILFEDDLF